MATLLRSLKFIRKLHLRGGRLGSSSHSFSSTALFTNTQLLQLSRAQCISLHESRTYVTSPVPKSKSYAHNNIDNMLSELDHKVRSYLGIYKTHVDQVLQAITEKGTLTSTQALLLIRCCGEFLSGENPEIRNLLTDQIWEIIEELRVPLDVSHYNALLLVYLENERDFSPVDILMQMKKNEIEPNRVTFQRLIEQYCNKGDIAGATKILEHMSEQEIPINENIFNSLIKGHSEAGDVPSAIKILDIMKNAGVEPSSRTYATILCAHAKRGDIESIRFTFNECREKNLQLVDKEILDIIFTFAVNKHLDLIDEMISYLTRGGLYNKDVAANILKLIEKNCTDVAYKLLKTMIKPENRENYESGGFFLRKLIVLGTNTETIIKYCKLLKEEKLHNAPFELSVIYMFTHGKPHSAIQVMKAWAETGAEIREHYFYPIFVAHSKDNNLQGLLNTVKTMLFDFKIVPSITTIKEYVAPFLVEDPLANVQTLVNNHLSFSNAANAILLHLLNESKVQQAYNFISSTNMTYRLNLLIRPLARALDRTKDVKSIAGLVHHQYVMAQKDQNNSFEDRLTPIEFSSLVVSRAATEIPTYDTNLMTEFLKNLLGKGVGINNETAQQVKMRLGTNITPDIEDILNKLVSNDLEPQDIEKNTNQRNQKRIYSSGLKEQAEESPEFKMLLIQQCARNKDKEAVEKLLLQLEQQNITYTIGFCATMVDYFSKIGNVQEATSWFNKLKDINADCKIDKAKLLNYANALVKSDCIDEALQVLKHSINDVDATRNTLCEILLDNVSSHCPDRVEEFFNLMQTQSFFTTVTTSLLTPLIRVPLRAGETEKAVEKFKWACENYKLTPCKIMLMSHLIKDEDAKTLKYVTDLATQVYGEMNSLFDLAVAFFESDRPHQARKILETPGLRLRKERITLLAEKYYNQGGSHLEGFVQLLNGMFLDMDPFYVLLLKSYGKRNEWQKCLALWTQMQEDNIQPSTTFMEELEQILKQCNQKIPFATSNRATTIGDHFDQQFTTAILDQNFEQAESILKEISSEARNRHRIKLTEAYLASNNLDKALSHLLIALDENHVVVQLCPDVIQNVIKKLVESDQFQLITNLMSKLHTTSRKIATKRVIAYNKFLNECYLKQGKYNQFLSHLEKLLTTPDSDLSTIRPLFHVSFTASILLQHPEYLEKINKLALESVKQNIHFVMSSLWIYHFIKENPEAEQIWNDHIKNTKEIQGIAALYVCKDSGAWDKIPKLVEKVAISQLEIVNKRRTLYVILRQLIASDESKKYEIAYECLHHIIKVIPVNNIDKEILLEIQTNLADGFSMESLKSSNTRIKEEATG